MRVVAGSGTEVGEVLVLTRELARVPREVAMKNVFACVSRVCACAGTDANACEGCGEGGGDGESEGEGKLGVEG